MLPDGLRHRAHSVPHENRLHSGEQMGVSVHLLSHVQAFIWQCSNRLSTLT